MKIGKFKIKISGKDHLEAQKKYKHTMTKTNREKQNKIMKKEVEKELKEIWK
jgi:hypothetical protein